MARYIKEFQTNVDPQTVHSMINQYLQSEGFEYINYDGENVFKKGQGVWTGPTFFKFSYFGNMVRMETWMKYAFFPGVYVGELGVTGFVGSAVKGRWKKRISYLENALANIAMQAAHYPAASVHNPNTFDDNETQLLNDNDSFEETCILNENKAEPVATGNVSLFCTGCGTQLPEGALFCTVCGQKRLDTNAQNIGSNNNVSYQQPYSQQNTFNNQNENPVPPTDFPISRKEFIDKYAQPSLRRNITSIAILCYVCAGITFIASCLVNPLGIIDALVLTGLALGMHLAKSKVCSILILILSIVEVLVSLIFSAFPFWWLVAGISAVVTFSKIDKQYKQFLNK